MKEYCQNIPEAGRILIAEDNHDFCEFLVRRLERACFKVFPAEDAGEAVGLLQKESFDLLVVDMYMPDGTGLDILAAAREKDSEIRAIVMTGSATVRNAVESLRAGVYDFLTKPIDPIAAFDLAVLRAMEQRRLLRENRNLFEEIQRLASHDPLTGLYNRFQMRRVLEREIQRCQRYQRPLSLLMIDLDYFKEINDTYGHIRGDQVLVHVAQTIRESIRKVDTAARFGGDEFIVIMPEADMQVASEAASRICSRVGRPVEGVLSVRVSIGAAVWTSSMQTIEELIREADMALYLQKAERRR